MSSAILLLSFLATVSVATAVFANGPTNPGMERFPNSRELEIESRVNELEAEQAIAAQRQSAITQSFSSEMTTLSKDNAAIKTTVSRLVEDSVQMMGRIRILQDVGSDVVDLRKFVNTIQKSMTDKASQVQTQVNSISGKLDQMASANTYITVGLSSQMKQNKDLLKTLQTTVAQIDSKIQAAEQKISSLESSAGSSVGESLAGTVAELKETLESFKNEQALKIENLQGALNELKSQMRRR